MGLAELWDLIVALIWLEAFPSVFTVHFVNDPYTCRIHYVHLACAVTSDKSQHLGSSRLHLLNETAVAKNMIHKKLALKIGKTFNGIIWILVEFLLYISSSNWYSILAFRNITLMFMLEWSERWDFVCHQCYLYLAMRTNPRTVSKARG